MSHLRVKWREKAAHARILCHEDETEAVLMWCDFVLWIFWWKSLNKMREVQICVDVIRMEVLSLSPTVRGGEEQKKVFKLLRFSAYLCSVWKELFSSLYSSSLFEEQRNINIILVQWNLINYSSNSEDIFMTFCCKEKLQEVPYLTPFFRDEKKHRERWCGGGKDFLLSLFSPAHHPFSSEISCIGQKKKLEFQLVLWPSSSHNFLACLS